MYSKGERMGAVKEQDIDNLNSQQEEAGEREQLTQEQREAINKTFKCIADAITPAFNRLADTIRATARIMQGFINVAQARLKHQRAIQGLKKDRKKGRRRSTKRSMRYKAYIFKGIAKAKSSRKRAK